MWFAQRKVISCGNEYPNWVINHHYSTNNVEGQIIVSFSQTRRLRR